MGRQLTIDNALDERGECDVLVYYGEPFLFRIEVFSQVQRVSFVIEATNATRSVSLVTTSYARNASISKCDNNFIILWPQTHFKLHESYLIVKQSLNGTLHSYLSSTRSSLSQWMTQFHG